MKSNYSIGKSIPSWDNGEAQTITFIVTEDCNLRCKYCYITHKSSNKKMNIEIAKKFIDFLFTNKINKSKSVIIEFIGGEPLLEIDLINSISDYFKIISYKKNHIWYWNYRLNICTNGVNFKDKRVQNYFKKNYNKLSVSITLDGTKEKHDLQRVFPDGTGSYNKIVENIPDWISKFNPGTKVTFASADLKFLKESVISLWGLGIKEVSANVVFEDIWKDGDDLIFENQLKDLADYIIENKLFDKYMCSFFDDQIGYSYTFEEKKQTYCGAGKMLALGPNGNLYPCIRYKDYSLNNKKEWTIGNVDKGICMDKIRPFLLSSIDLQSDKECLNCEVATGCGFCQGFNYDTSLNSTNFHRAKYICKMHKARVRANNYYFNLLYNNYDIKRQTKRMNKKSLYILLDSQYTSFCQNLNTSDKYEEISDTLLIQGIDFAFRNFYDIVVVHSENKYRPINFEAFKGYDIKHIIPIEFFESAKKLKKVDWIFNKNNLKFSFDNIENCILNVHESDLENLANYFNMLYEKVNRININIMCLSKNFNYIEYKTQLVKIKELIVLHKNNTGRLIEVNILTDLLYIDNHDNCKAGDLFFTLGPDENLYVCPAFYNEGVENKIGDLKEGLYYEKKNHLYKNKFNPLCRECNSYHCINCVHLNKVTTNEVNVSPSFQCKKSHIESLVAFQMRDELENNNTYKKINISERDDPLIKLMSNPAFHSGVYNPNSD